RSHHAPSLRSRRSPSPLRERRPFPRSVPLLSMRIPLSWLADFVTSGVRAEVLADRLTMAGVKIEAIEEVGRVDPRVRVGRLLATEPHPEAAHLWLWQVDVGGAGPIVVVSGAPLASGQLVPVALP